MWNENDMVFSRFRCSNVSPIAPFDARTEAIRYRINPPFCAIQLQINKVLLLHIEKWLGAIAAFPICELTIKLDEKRRIGVYTTIGYHWPNASLQWYLTGMEFRLTAGYVCFFIRNSIRTRNDAHLMAISISIFHFRINFTSIVFAFARLIRLGSTATHAKPMHISYSGKTRPKSCAVYVIMLRAITHSDWSICLFRWLRYLRINLAVHFFFHFLLCFGFEFINSCWVVLRRAVSSFDMQLFGCFAFGRFHFNNKRKQKLTDIKNLINGFKSMAFKAVNWMHVLFYNCIHMQMWIKWQNWQIITIVRCYAMSKPNETTSDNEQKLITNLLFVCMTFCVS